uniref:Uncharacterized protein n=1 Tax=Arundo donax TaxID=35708 RepID=A0A0A9DBV6_ARUDO
MICCILGHENGDGNRSKSIRVVASKV